jgi:putative endonuclease
VYHCSGFLDEEDYAMRNYNFYVYIVTNKNKTVLYIGVTNDLARRLSEHELKINKGFTSRYNCHHLVYYENFKYINDAIAREKYLKGILRSKKEKLIADFNPAWNFLNQRFNHTLPDELLRII